MEPKSPTAPETVIMVYVTAPNRDEALRLAEAVVEARLAACANILDSVTSLFRWQGEVRRESEVALILKTRAGLFAALKQRITEIHSYEIPCVVAWPVGDGNGPFLDWVRDETRQA